MKDTFCCTKGVIILFHFTPQRIFIAIFCTFLFCVDFNELKLMFSLGDSLVQNTHQESRGAVQEASDSGNETSVEKAGELRRNSPGLRRMEQTAHDKVLT